MAITVLKQKLTYDIEDATILPLTVKQKSLIKLNELSKRIKDSAKGTLKYGIKYF